MVNSSQTSDNQPRITVTRNSHKILYWNCHGLSNKFIEIMNFIKSNNISIALLCETWIKPTFKLRYHPEYNIHRLDRLSAPHGGVAIVINKSIKYTIMPNLASLKVIKAIGIYVDGPTSITKIVSVYFPGSTSAVVKRNCYQTLGLTDKNSIQKAFKGDLHKLMSMGDIIICGDLNARNNAWNCYRNNVAGNTLYDILSRNSMFKIMYLPSSTYVPLNQKLRPSTIDVVLSNIPNFIKNINILNLFNSDHYPVTFDFSQNIPKLTIDKYYLDYTNANWPYSKL